MTPAWFLLGKEEPPSNPPRKVRGLLHLSLTYLVYFSPNFHHFFWSASSFASFRDMWFGLFDSLKSQGKVEVYQDMTVLYSGSDLDFLLDVNGIGAIYGDGGWNRYVVKVSGEVLFMSKAARNPANKEIAANSGFRFF
jgi:hypothetical protein